MESIASIKKKEKVQTVVPDVLEKVYKQDKKPERSKILADAIYNLYEELEYHRSIVYQLESDINRLDGVLGAESGRDNWEELKYI